MSPPSNSRFERSIARPLLAAGTAIVVLAGGVLVGFRLAPERAASGAVTAPASVYVARNDVTSAPTATTAVGKEPDLDMAAPHENGPSMALAPSAAPTTKVRKSRHRPHGANSQELVVPGSKGVHRRAGGAPRP